MNSMPEPEIDYASWPQRFFHVTPDEIDDLVVQLRKANPPCLTIDEFPQFCGRTVHAFTMTDRSIPLEEKKRLFVSRPHAHEPAGTAACTELVKLLVGCGDSSKGNEAFREFALRTFVLTVVPDANPCGSQRAPVKFWDGTAIPNEEFFLWMFGESGEKAGERFPRIDEWDIRKVVPTARIGIAYEQIDEYTCVEPNRSHKSTFFRSFFELDETYHYQCWLDLHQTEFINSKQNTHAFLSSCYPELPPRMQRLQLSLAESIHKAWEQAGAIPDDRPIVPYSGNPEQRNLLARAWRPIVSRLVHCTAEVQNNHPRTPVADQVRFELTAILATMNWMATQEKE